MTLPGRPPVADNTPAMPPTVKAILVRPGPARRREMRTAEPPTYRLLLQREDTGQVLHTWSGIPHDKVGPLLLAMQRYLPWLARAAAARDAISKLLDLFA